MAANQPKRVALGQRVVVTSAPASRAAGREGTRGECWYKGGQLSDLQRKGDSLIERVRDDEWMHVQEHGVCSFKFDSVASG